MSKSLTRWFASCPRVSGSQLAITSRGARVLTEVFAHRGSAQAARENTTAAFVAARQLGADGVELDVHLSADRVVVVHHDAEVPGHGPISALSSLELPDWLPTLGEALDACRPLRVNIEIKHDQASGAGHDDSLALEVAALVSARPEAARIVVSSFSLPAIDALHAYAPALATALLVEPADDAMTAVKTAYDRGHGGVHPFFLSVDEALMKAARASGVAVRTWTVDDPGFVATLAELGVDAVITNDVAAALRPLGRFLSQGR
jgi:glycerophosphoryl diester phosphodiesterase